MAKTRYMMLFCRHVLELFRVWLPCAASIILSVHLALHMTMMSTDVLNKSATS